MELAPRSAKAEEAAFQIFQVWYARGPHAARECWATMSTDMRRPWYESADAAGLAILYFEEPRP